MIGGRVCHLDKPNGRTFSRQFILSFVGYISNGYSAEATNIFVYYRQCRVLHPLLLSSFLFRFLLYCFFIVCVYVGTPELWRSINLLNSHPLK